MMYSSPADDGDGLASNSEVVEPAWDPGVCCCCCGGCVCWPDGWLV